MNVTVEIITAQVEAEVINQYTVDLAIGTPGPKGDKGDPGDVGNIDLSDYALKSYVDDADAYLQGQIANLSTLNNNQQTELNVHDGRIVTLETNIGQTVNDINKLSTIGHNVTPGGTIDGVNTTFTTPDVFISGTLKVYYNGLRLRAGVDYDEAVSYDGFEMLYVIPMDTSNWLLCDYIKQ